MNITDLLTGKLDKEVMEELSRSTGADKEKIEEAIKIGMPTLLQAMGANANSPAGAASLAKALDSHRGSEVGDMAGFLKNVDAKDGAKILGHILGGDNKKVQSNISRQTGLKEYQVSGLLSQLAPLLLGMLGKEKSSNNLSSMDLSAMLRGLMGITGSRSVMKKVTKMLDSDGDGNILDDLGKIAGGLFKKDPK